MVALMVASMDQLMAAWKVGSWAANLALMSADRKAVTWVVCSACCSVDKMAVVWADSKGEWMEAMTADSMETH